MKFKRLLFLSTMAAVAVCSGMVGCNDDQGYQEPPDSYPPDPGKTTTFTGYSPSQASVRTLIFIDGDNFGTDVSRINVTIGGKKAPVISSNGKIITAMTPRNSVEQIIDQDKGIGTATLRVEMLNEDGTVYQEKVFDEKLEIKIATTVATLTGKKDPATGQSSLIDGPLDVAEFYAPWWLELTRNNNGEKVLIVHDGRPDGEYGHLRAVREINLETGMVSTPLTQSQIGLNQGLSIAMDPTGDTLFILNDNGVGDVNNKFAMPAVYRALRSDDFGKAEPYQYSSCCYSGVWFKDGTFFYNTYTNGMVYRGRGFYNTTVNMWEGSEVFGTWAPSGGSGSGHQYMAKHPDERYIYVTGNSNAVTKVPYDKAARNLTRPLEIIAGATNYGSGYAGGPTAQSRFTMTRQGVFVKNQAYVDADPTGLADHYDFYFCDQKNNCIWKMTPQGVTSLFAGRGSQGQGTAGGTYGQYGGYIDGDPIETARFDQPIGIAYDEETEIFYIADRGNRRIRTIMVE
jgi:hypothetical protein